MKCLIEGCLDTDEKRIFVRGLCQSHYAALSKMVREERTTWRQLEEFGMSIPPRRMKKGLAEAQYEKSLKRLRKED